MATIKQRIDGVTENVTDGKQDIASAITEKGVTTANNATFSTMANNIRAIESGAKDRIVNSSGVVGAIAGVSGVTIGCIDEDSNYNVASGQFSIAMGSNANVIGAFSIAEGSNSYARGEASHVEGESCSAESRAAHAEGDNCIASGECTHAEGYNCYAIADYSHAEGHATQSRGLYSHTEGYGTATEGDDAHAEGNITKANGNNSHAEGNETVVNGENSHAEGSGTKALGDESHTEGVETIANGQACHAEGYRTTANGTYVHAEGFWTKTFNQAEHASGRYNNSFNGSTGDTSATLFSVGIGTSDTNRKNAIEITQTGVLKANTSWTTGSDRKLKKDINPLSDNVLEKVLQLNPVSFVLKDDLEDRKQIGFIAQEVEDVFPEYVIIQKDNEGGETRYLDYEKMVSILCKAIQEQEERILLLESKIK